MGFNRLIAEVMNRNDLADTVITYLKAMYAFWVSASTSTPFTSCGFVRLLDFLQHESLLAPPTNPY